MLPSRADQVLPARTQPCTRTLSRSTVTCPPASGAILPGGKDVDQVGNRRVRGDRAEDGRLETPPDHLRAGAPLAVPLTGLDRIDVTQLIPLLNTIRRSAVVSVARAAGRGQLQGHDGGARHRRQVTKAGTGDHPARRTPSPRRRLCRSRGPELRTHGDESSAKPFTLLRRDGLTGSPNTSSPIRSMSSRVVPVMEDHSQAATLSQANRPHGPATCLPSARESPRPVRHPVDGEPAVRTQMPDTVRCRHLVPARRGNVDLRDRAHRHPHLHREAGRRL